MTGELYINGTDAYTAWGVSMEEGALANLMAPPPMKEPVVNNNVTAHGMSVVVSGYRDARTVSVPLHLVASSSADFAAKRASFLTALSAGSLAIRVGTVRGVTLNRTYNMLYIDCPQYMQFLGGIAKFSLNLYEPEPAFE
jgi:hypothetical protein